MFSRDKISAQALSLPDRHEMSDEEMAAAARDFAGVMARRHSVRDYSNRPVSRQVIEARFVLIEQAGDLEIISQPGFMCYESRFYNRRTKIKSMFHICSF